MGYLKKYWKKYKPLFFVSIFCVSCEAACDLLQPRLMARLIDRGAVLGDMDFVINTGLAMLGVALAGAVFAAVRNISASLASQGFGADLRYDMFASINSFSIEHADRFDGGSLVTRMTNDISQLQNFANGMMRIFFKAPVMCAGAVIGAASLNLKTLPIIAPIVAIVAAAIFISMKMTYPRFAKVQAALDKLNTVMREYLAGIRLVKAFRRFDGEAARFSEVNGELAGSTVKAGRTLAVFSPFFALCVNFGIAAIIFFGARLVDMKEMRAGEIMAFVTYMTQLLGSLGMISNVLNMLVRVKISNERIGEIFAVPKENVCSFENYPSALSGKSARIVFDGVGFEYPDSTAQAALSDLNFSVEKGETLGVIGPTGSGKSTLAALLMRFYGAARGQIRLFDTPINEIPEEELRGKVAIVPQTASLFTGTVRENILWGKKNASDAEIETASRTAEAHEFISEMPKAYNTALGQHGVNLSGGQKQRISIARALLRAPEILILDDCTSALDVMTEAKVKRALKHTSENMICILITQRVSTAMACDKILVLENGFQAGFGSHEKLIESCPVYRDICTSQIGEEKILK